MAPRSRLGDFERCVMLAVNNLGDTAYGTTVIEEIERLTLREASFAAAYTTLKRLELKGLLRSTVGEPTVERGGRAKRYFSLTRVGETTLANSLQELRQLSASIKLTEEIA